jgi:hypothetical protein
MINKIKNQILLLPFLLIFSCNSNHQEVLEELKKDTLILQPKPEPELSIGSIGEGGIVASINNGHGLVAAEQDNGSGTWDEAMQSSKGYSQGGYSDWRLPQKDELYLLYNNLHKQGIGDFSQENYWSSTDKDESAWCLYFQTGEYSLGVKGSHNAYYDRATESIQGSNDKIRIRLVRTF